MVQQYQLFYKDNGVTKYISASSSTRQSALDRYPGYILIEVENIEYPEFQSVMEINESNEVVYNFAAAKELKKDQIRTLRTSEFEKTDKEYIENLSQDNVLQIAEVKIRQQYLRDLPQQIDAIVDLETLYNFSIN